MPEPKEIKISQVYDSEDDVYYVSFETGEPSYVEEVDDDIVIELGIFTNMPTGFRILNFKNLTAKIELEMKQMQKKIQKAMEVVKKEYPANFRHRENQVTTALQKAFA